MREPASWLRAYADALERWQAAKDRVFPAQVYANDGPDQRKAYADALVAEFDAAGDLERLASRAVGELLFLVRKAAERDTDVGRSFRLFLAGAVADREAVGRLADRVEQLEAEVRELAGAIVDLESGVPA